MGEITEYVKVKYSEMSVTKRIINSIWFISDSTLGIIYRPSKFFLNWSNLAAVCGDASTPLSSGDTDVSSEDTSIRAIRS